MTPGGTELWALCDSITGCGFPSIFWHGDYFDVPQVRPRAIWGGVGQEELLSARILRESNMPRAQVKTNNISTWSWEKYWTHSVQTN